MKLEIPEGSQLVVPVGRVRGRSQIWCVTSEQYDHTSSTSMPRSERTFFKNHAPYSLTAFDPIDEAAWQNLSSLPSCCTLLACLPP